MGRCRAKYFMLLVSLSATVMAQQTREQLASQLFSQGAFGQAAELYESLYDRAANAYYYQMLLRSYVELDEQRKAETLVKQRMKRYPQELSLYVDLGRVYGNRGEAKRERRAYEEALSRLSRDARQAESLANAFDAAGQVDYAVRTYLTSRERMNNPYLYVNELASLYARQGDYDAMMAEYFGLLDRNPGSLESLQVMLQRLLSEASDESLSEALQRTLVSRVREKPDSQENLDMMMWFSLQQKDFRFAFDQARAIDGRFPDRQGDVLWRVAQIAQSNGCSDVAAEAYALLAKKGSQNPYYFDSRVQQLKIEFNKLDENYHLSRSEASRLRDRYESTLAELGRDLRTVPLMRDFSHLLAYRMDEEQAAADLLYDILDMPQLPAAVRDEVKLELGDLLLFAGAVWDASLLYMQVEKANKDDLLGAVAKFRNAKLSYYNCDFSWACSQLDVLRASTSKLVANDAMELSLLISDNMDDDSTYGMLTLFSHADLLLYRNKFDSAWCVYDDISRRVLSHPLLDEVLMRKAQIRMKQARYADADSLLSRLSEQYPDDILADDALFMRAELNEHQLGRPDVARACYERLLLDYSSSLFVDQARRRFDELRNR